MSKYIYSTVYEEFTGLKPPEPKSHKPRRRRGYGHPYRMRLNMQDSENQEHDEREDHDESFLEEDYELQPNTIPSLTQVNNKPTYSVRTTPYQSIGCTPVFEDQAASPSPKVTYKKRRHYGPDLTSESVDTTRF